LHYFVRAIDLRKEGRNGSTPLVKTQYAEQVFAALGQAIDQAKQIVKESDRTLMLQADACSRNRNQVQTKFRCWIDERGAFHERILG
jgi:hypothetical protein